MTVRNASVAPDIPQTWDWKFQNPLGIRRHMKSNLSHIVMPQSRANHSVPDVQCSRLLEELSVLVLSSAAQGESYFGALYDEQ